MTNPITGMSMSDEEMREVVNIAAKPLNYSLWLGRPYAEWKAAYAGYESSMLARVPDPDEHDYFRAMLREYFYWEGTPFEHKMINAEGIIVSDNPYVDPDDPAD